MLASIISKTIVVFSLVALSLSLTFAQVPDPDKVIAGAERAWEKTIKSYVAPGPGCAAGVSVNGRSVFEKAFGMAEIEHGNSNTPETIFESGSVAKQFTAAALVLLERDGKLNLDDPVRKFIPELPDYGSPLTIRNMLNHTAGLRDWGTVLSLTPAGRGDRVISQDLALDIVIHQKALDFTPGAEYSYSNSGYNLAAIIVERVSGKKFPDFVTERIFKPLGMTHSSWRDDYQRIVPGRAQAYSRRGREAPWRLDMPFMNVYGNGGMLTTVGDWLKWNAALETDALTPGLFETLTTKGVLNDGRKINYALGIGVGTYKGLRDISHGGSTAGYQTFLAYYPDQKVSVAVMCNGTSPSAGGLAAGITDEILGPFAAPPSGPEAVNVTEDELKRYVSLWRNEKTHDIDRTTVEKGQLRLNGAPLVPLGGNKFLFRSTEITFNSSPDGKLVSAVGDNGGAISRFIAESEWVPAADALKAFVGDWYSEEAQSEITIVVEGGKAFAKQRPALKLPLNPTVKDHFEAQGYIIWFTRDAKGNIDAMHIGTTRMRDMPFVRVKR